LGSMLLFIPILLKIGLFTSTKNIASPKNDLAFS